VSTGACAFRAQSSAHAALCATHSKDPAWVHPASSKIGRYASIGQPDEPLPWTTVEPFAAPSTYGVATSVRLPSARLQVCQAWSRPTCGSMKLRPAATCVVLSPPHVLSETHREAEASHGHAVAGVGGHRQREAHH
jgi:hypothetical protein